MTNGSLEVTVPSQRLRFHRRTHSPRRFALICATWGDIRVIVCGITPELIGRGDYIQGWTQSIKLRKRLSALPSDEFAGAFNQKNGTDTGAVLSGPSRRPP